MPMSRPSSVFMTISDILTHLATDSGGKSDVSSRGRRVVFKYKGTYQTNVLKRGCIADDIRSR